MEPNREANSAEPVEPPIESLIRRFMMLYAYRSEP